jgi:hypothetical protein
VITVMALQEYGSVYWNMRSMQVFDAIKDSLKSMLQFIVLVTSGDAFADHEPESAVLPAGFLPQNAVKSPALTKISHSTIDQSIGPRHNSADEAVGAGVTELTPTAKEASRDMVTASAEGSSPAINSLRTGTDQISSAALPHKPTLGPSGACMQKAGQDITAGVGPEQQSDSATFAAEVAACSRALAQLLAHVPDELSNHLLDALPQMCAWAVRRTSAGRAAAVPIHLQVAEEGEACISAIGALVPVVHRMVCLRASGRGESECEVWRTVATSPEALASLVLFLVIVVRKCVDGDAAEGLVWRRTMGSFFGMACEVIVSVLPVAGNEACEHMRLVLREEEQTARLGAVQLGHERLVPWDCGLAVGADAVCTLMATLAARLSGHVQANSMHGLDLNQMAEQVLSGSLLLAAHLQMTRPHSQVCAGDSHVVEIACEGLRFTIVTLLAAGAKPHRPEVVELLGLAQEFWGLSAVQQLLARSQDGWTVATDSVLERSLQLCASLTTCSAVNPAVALFMRERCWLSSVCLASKGGQALLRALQAQAVTAPLASALCDIAGDSSG